MKEEKYIQSLFETARSEEPQLSFEEASETFEASLSPGLAASIKDWFLNHVYLNSFIMMSTIGIIATVIFLNFQPEETQIVTVPVIEKIPEVVAVDSIVPVTVTVETQNEIVEISLKADPDKIRVTKTPIKQVEISETLAEVAEPQNRIDLVPEITMSESEEKRIDEPTEKIIESEIKPVSTKKSNPKIAKNDFGEGRRMPIRKRELSELEVVLETALNLDHLKKDLFASNREGEYHQLVMRTNGKFDHLVDIQFSGKKVIVIPNNHREGFNVDIVGSEFVDIQKFELGEKKAFLKFLYNSVIVQIRMIKEDGIWFYKSTNTDHQQQDYIVREELLQLMLNHKRMLEIIEQDKDREYKPLTLLSNGFFSTMVEVTFDNKFLKIVPNKYNHDFNRKMPYANFTKFQIKRRKATIQFAYKGHLVEANFRKKNGAWLFKSFIHKEGQNTYKDINF